MNYDAFTRAYLEAALWSSTDDTDDTDDTGEPLDREHGADDIAPESLEKMVRDCALFQEANAETLAPFDDADCGHDFWLTRNGHGAGFWDGDYPADAGLALTRASRLFGECNLYVGDDGKIHAS